MARTKRHPDPQLADRLKAVRAKLALTQPQMADRLGMSLRAYKYAEDGSATSHPQAILLALRALEAGMEP